MSSLNRSVIVGNGFDIQIGGDDYLNKWIMARIIIKCKLGLYDCLFTDENTKEVIIKGDEIVKLLNSMLKISTNALEGKYDDLIKSSEDSVMLEALEDFKKRYINIPKRVEQIGIEDWILIFKLYITVDHQISEQYSAAKTALEWMILDSIYCEGNIQSLYKVIKSNNKAKDFFNGFNNIFTLNYDHTIEKSTKQTVMHLHGSYDDKFPSYCPIKHCRCSAILDFSGGLKYHIANARELSFSFVKMVTIENNKISNLLNDVTQKILPNTGEFVNMCKDQGIDLSQKYYFDSFEKLEGELIMIGISPNNDSHIFSLIDKSNIDRVIFYNFFGNGSQEENTTLPLKKPYEIKDIQSLWNELGLKKPQPNKTYTISNEQFRLINSITSSNPITKQQLEMELNSIPNVSRGLLNKLIEHEINKEDYHKSPSSEKELARTFYEFEKALDIASINARTIYAMYFLKNYSK